VVDDFVDSAPMQAVADAAGEVAAGVQEMAAAVAPKPESFTRIAELGEGRTFSRMLVDAGIPAEMATPYYETALEAAKEVITQASAYYNLDITIRNDLGQNFYNAVCVKENNHEVIWAKDYAYPGATHGFTQKNIPASLAEDQERCYSGAVLNLVEAFEYKDNRDHTNKGRTHNDKEYDP
jgi:hypothetical protein